MAMTSSGDAAHSTTRLYGGTIAVVSGIYSLLLGAGGEMVGADWVMFGLGMIVLVHGVVLFASPSLLSGISGPLMVVYALLMLGNQVWMTTMDPMGTSMGMGFSSGMGPGYDLGMIAIAVIMLASGIIMIRRPGM